MKRNSSILNPLSSVLDPIRRVELPEVILLLAVEVGYLIAMLLDAFIR